MDPTNTTILTGRLTQDPELRSTPGGKSVTTLTLAVRCPGRDEDGNSQADFFDVTVWEGQAETCVKHLGKGRLVTVAARLKLSRWETKDGEKRRSLEIVASNVRFLDAPRRQIDAPEVPVQPEEVPAAA